MSRNIKSNEQFIFELIGLECLNHLEILGKYTGSNNRILCKCKHCGKEVPMFPQHIRKNKTGCKDCCAKKYFDEHMYLNKTYNNLTIIKFQSKETDKCRVCICECKCGYIGEFNFHSLIGLRIKDCGCSRARISKICEYCKKEFFVIKSKSATSKHCCIECKRLNSNKSTNKICENCGKIFSVPYNKMNSKKYCSRKCYNVARKNKSLVERFCLYCNKSFICNKSNKKKYCSSKCASDDRTDNVNKRYCSVRKTMMENGDISYCEICGYDEHPEILGVHHKDRNTKNNNSDNLIVLCPICHSLEHGGHLINRGNNNCAKMVVCLNTMNIFNSMIDASRFFNISHSGISKCCSGYSTNKYCGKHPVSGESLLWEFYDKEKHKNFMLIEFVNYNS